jgi:NADPH:quinone reductase-like Zn-dependent oxidoreductase
VSLGASEIIDYHTERIEDRIKDYDVFIDVLGYKYEDIVLDSKSHILRRSGEFPSHYIRIASSPHELEESDPHISRDPLGLAIPEASAFRVVKGAAKQLFNSYSNIRYHFILVKPDKLALQVAAEAMKEGKIRAIIQAVIPLREAARAHIELEGGHVTGKLVLCVNESMV